MNPRPWIVFTLALAALGGGILPALAANTLLDVRVGPHKHFDRVVFEFESEATGRVALKDNQKIEVRFSDVRLPDRFSLPALPRGLAVLRGIDAYREGKSDLVFEMLLARDATPSELPLQGRPWRLALDLAPRVNEQPEAKPPYVPGDRPIPTKFVENPVTPADTVNTGQIRAVLAYYYLAQGDTRRALEQAALYQALTGAPLDLDLNRSAPQALRTPLPAWKAWRLSPALPLLAALGIGVVLGILISGFAPRVRISVRGADGSLRGKKNKTARDLAEEIASDLAVLDEAVQQGTAPAPVEPPAAAEEHPPEDDVENGLREASVDRRVARVIELSREGRSVAAIAEELHMGQDEVRLILDLKNL